MKKKRAEPIIEKPEVFTVYHVGESRNGRIKFTTDVDCLSPDIIRYSTQVFSDRRALFAQAELLVSRGFTVCIDDDIECTEFSPYIVNGKIEGSVQV